MSSLRRPNETRDEWAARLEREEAAAAIRRTFRPFKDPDVIPDLRDVQP